jgi:hypothetical protein
MHRAVRRHDVGVRFVHVYVRVYVHVHLHVHVDVHDGGGGLQER